MPAASSWPALLGAGLLGGLCSSEAAAEHASADASRLMLGGDTCASAVDLVSAIPGFACDGLFRADEPIGMASATPSGFPAPGCFKDASVQSDRWYTWTNTTGIDKLLQVSTDDPANAGADSQLAAFIDCATPGRVACDDDAGSAALSLMTVCVTFDSTVFVMLDGNAGDVSFERALFRCLPPLTAVGESCFTAIDVASLPGFACDGAWHVAEPLGMATAEPTGLATASCLSDGVDNDRWFRWTNTTGAPAGLEVSTDDPANLGSNSTLAIWGRCACRGALELACDDDSGSLDLRLSNAGPVAVAPGDTVYVQIDGFAADRSFDRGLFRCAACAPPAGATDNALRAVKEAARDVRLRWPAATVSPAAFALFGTDRKEELSETPTGIGDEARLATTGALTFSDRGALDRAPAARYYELLAADFCGAPAFP